MRRGLILQPTYRIRSGIPVIQLFGRLEDGPAFLVEDDRFRPYFFVPASEASRLEGAGSARVTPSDYRDLEGAPLVRVTADLPGEVPEPRNRATRPLESDIRFPYRYLIDRGIRAAIGIERDGSRGTSLSPTRRTMRRLGSSPVARPAAARATCIGVASTTPRPLPV